MWEVGGTGWRNSRAFRLRLVWVASFRQGANARFCRRTSLSRWDQEYWLEVSSVFPLSKLGRISTMLTPQGLFAIRADGC